MRVRGLTPQSRLLGRRLHFASFWVTSGKATGEPMAAAQHFAHPNYKVHACASLAGDPLVIVLGRIFIVVQPMLDLHPSDRAGEKQCGHHSKRRRSKQLGSQSINAKPLVRIGLDLSQKAKKEKWRCSLRDSEMAAGESFSER